MRIHGDGWGNLEGMAARGKPKHGQRGNGSWGWVAGDRLDDSDWLFQRFDEYGIDKHGSVCDVGKFVVWTAGWVYFKNVYELGFDVKCIPRDPGKNLNMYWDIM